MKFQNPEFKEGINMTVRRGVKTYQEVEQLTDADNNLVGWGKIYAVKLMRFCDITEWLISQYHHLQEVRKDIFIARDVLASKMKEHYPMFGVEEIVTVVYFEVINEKGQ